MVGHGGGLLQRTAVLQIRRDAGRAEAVIADRCGDAGRCGAAADHGVGVGLAHCCTGQRPSRHPRQRREQRSLGVVAQNRAVEIRRKILLKIMVAGHGVRLAAFLPQPDLEAAVLHEHVFDLHGERRADPRERIDHEGNQGAIAQAYRRRRVECCRGAAAPRRVPAPASCRISRCAADCRDDLADHKPIEQAADGGEVLPAWVCWRVSI
jgi:hypothetical protein